MSQVAQTILSQLGGSRFLAMTGAKNLVTTTNSLHMKIGKNSKAVTHVVVTLNDTDDYNMQALSIRGTKEPVSKGVYANIHAHQLQMAFKELTGLETSL